MNINDATQLMLENKKVRRPSWPEGACLFIILGNTVHPRYQDKHEPVYDHNIKARSADGTVKNWKPIHQDLIATDYEVRE